MVVAAAVAANIVMTVSGLAVSPVLASDAKGGLELFLAPGALGGGGAIHNEVTPSAGFFARGSNPLDGVAHLRGNPPRVRGPGAYESADIVLEQTDDALLPDDYDPFQEDGDGKGIVAAYAEPREPEGCCFPDGSCSNMEPDDCIDMEGTPMGVFCYGEQLACCLDDGTCVMADPLCCEPELGGTVIWDEVCGGEAEACCFVDGTSATCMDADPTCCQDTGGVPQGSDTECTVGEACCLDDGTCVMADPLCCDEMGGVAAGPGIVCEWETKACCFDDGFCMEVDPACCEALGGWSSPMGEEHCLGDLNGNGTDDACEEPEACCLEGGACVPLPAYQCEQMLGVPQGAGTMCTEAEACCLDDGVGTCVMIDPLCCDELGGVAQGAGTACSEVEGCCLDDGTCLDVDPLCCDELDGVAQGAGNTCSGVTIACCLDGGATCVDVDWLCCDDLGGAPGYASICLGDGDGNGIDDACEPQVVQACCLENGDCVEVIPDVCIFNGGTPQGSGTQCTAEEACCLEDDTCVMVDPLCCDELDGVAQGSGTECTAEEACCLDDGTCVMVDPLCCDELGGIWQGPFAMCTQLEACCLEDDGTCVMVDPLCCDEMGGVPQGPFTACTEPEACCLDEGACAEVAPLCCEQMGGWPSPIGEPHCLGDLNSNGIDDACDEPVSKWSQWPHGPEEGFDAASGYWWYEPPPKWEQEPNLDLPGLHAHDWDEDPGYHWITLADDWLCEGGSVTELQWWGNYELDFEGQEIRGSGIAFFQVSIHTCAPGPQGWCVPAESPLWWDIVPFGSVAEQDTGTVNPEGSPIYLYEYDLPEPFPQEAGVFYWFNLAAFSADATDPAVWRWQEARHYEYPPLGHAPAAQKLDDGPWESIIWDDDDPEEYSDMAFRVISTQALSKPWPNKVVADDFISDGRPIEALHWWGSYLDPQYAPGPDPVEPYILDGWFISFHHTEPGAVCPPDALAGDDPTVLGVYFAPAEAVRIDSLDMTDCFGHDVYEYFIDLDQCCLICAEEDPRDSAAPADPARPGEFLETAGLPYWAGIQAVVGVEWLPDSDPPCWKTLTGHEPPPGPGDRHFWGWHTSPDANLEEACTGKIYGLSPYPPECWDYGDWIKQDWLCPETPREPVNMSFELLTGAALPGDCDGDNDVDLDDYAVFEGCITGPNGGPIDPSCRCADLDADDDVDLADFAEFQVVFAAE